MDYADLIRPHVEAALEREQEMIKQAIDLMLADETKPGFRLRWEHTLDTMTATVEFDPDIPRGEVHDVTTGRVRVMKVAL